jgi:hypothetical protein
MYPIGSLPGQSAQEAGKRRRQLLGSLLGDVMA